MKSILPVLLVCGILTAEKANAGRFTMPQVPSLVIARSYNTFGFQLLNETRIANPGKNVFLSPVGLGFALSMVADGARGQTLREINDALQWTNSEAALDEANQALLQNLTTLDPAIKLEIANSIWIAQDAIIKPPYLATLRQSYSAEATNANFSDPTTAQKINDWCAAHTHGKISEMVEPPLDAERLLLLDAVYFKGDWAAPFDKSGTSDQPFTLGDGKVVTHPLMERAGEFAYDENEDYQAVCLPYKSYAINMYVYLPKKNLSDLLQKLTLTWRQWNSFDSRRGTLKLPRFKIENSYGLNDVLKALSMRAAFTPKADFRGISDEHLYIDWVKQKTYVDVNEEGTEAAAVSGVTMRAMAIRQEEPPFTMIVDRPFFLAICDESTGAILFLGAIVDPR